MSVEIAVRAHAKINLFLRLVGRRADGYHLLESLVAFAGPHDTVTVAADGAIGLTVDGPFAAELSGPAEANLVHRAACLLRDARAPGAGARIRLTKNLPVASGIGGGSADAAATLRALCRLWSLRPAPGEMAALGLALGADVPVCLAGVPALMSGIGDLVAPVGRLPSCGILLVNPRMPVATAEVFRRRSGPFSAPRGDLGFSLPAGADAAALADALRHAAGGRGNDLAAPALSVAPVIADVLAALDRTPDCLLSRLSGSGATCFGLYADAATAAAAAEAVTLGHPDWWVAPGSLCDDGFSAPPVSPPTRGSVRSSAPPCPASD